MATRQVRGLPQVKVAPTGPGGFTITCTACPSWTIRRPYRQEADLLAVEHRASHQTPLHDDDGSDDTSWRID